MSKPKSVDEVIDAVIKTVSYKCVREHGEHLATFEEIHTLVKDILTDWLESRSELTCWNCGHEVLPGKYSENSCIKCEKKYKIKYKTYATEEI